MSGDFTKAPSLIIGAVYLLASIFLVVRSGGAHWEVVDLPFAVFVTGWVAAPIVSCVWIGRTLHHEWTMLLFFTGVIVVGLWGYYEQWRTLFVLPADGQSVIALLIGPVYQWVGIGLCAGGVTFLDRYVEGH